MRIIMIKKQDQREDEAKRGETVTITILNGDSYHCPYLQHYATVISQSFHI